MLYIILTTINELHTYICDIKNYSFSVLLNDNILIFYIIMIQIGNGSLDYQYIHIFISIFSYNLNISWFLIIYVIFKYMCISLYII